MKEDDLFAVRWEELQNVRKQEVLGKSISVFNLMVLWEVSTALFILLRVRIDEEEEEGADSSKDLKQSYRLFDTNEFFFIFFPIHMLVG